MRVLKCGHRFHKGVRTLAVTYGETKQRIALGTSMSCFQIVLSVPHIPLGEPGEVGKDKQPRPPHSLLFMDPGGAESEQCSFPGTGFFTYTIKAEQQSHVSVQCMKSLEHCRREKVNRAGSHVLILVDSGLWPPQLGC